MVCRPDYSSRQNRVRMLRAGTVPALALLLIAAPAAADIYSYIDREGVVHFTNIPRPGSRWKRLMREGPGKAAVVHARRSRRLSAARYSRYDAHIRQAAALYHLPVALLRAVIRTESDYDPRAVSRVGAAGLMQLMPQTASEMGVTDIFNPRQNIFGGARYLRILANRFRGDLMLTIAGYHAGAGAVLRYGSRVPPYVTTQAYVKLVIKRYRKYSRHLS